MLEFSAVDLDALGEALEDHSNIVRWFLNPADGEVSGWSEDMDEPCPQDAGAVYVEPVPSFEAYADMEEFVALVPDRQAAAQLRRAIEGRGAFRRFKDTLFQFPQLRERWFAFHDARLRRRAVEWLIDRELIDEAAGAAVLATLDDPAVGEGIVDAFELARTVARELRAQFAERLVDVVLFGSYATGTATDDSDLDLAVILRESDDPWADARIADPILWRHTADSGITISTLMIDKAKWADPQRPLERSAKASGLSVA